MAELKTRKSENDVNPELDTSLQRIGEDLEIMDRYAGEMETVEHEIKEDLRKWDREYKDSCLHSTPKPRKHLR